MTGTACYVHLDWTPSAREQKIIPEKNRNGDDNFETPLESSRQGESKSAWSICVNSFLTFFQNNFPNISQTKTDHADLDSTRRIFLFRGLRPF